MNWHILGAGSLGLLWAARLARGLNPVTLVMRDRAAVRVWEQHHSLLTLRDDDQHSSWQIPAEPPDAPGPIEALILATKAYAVLPALESVAPRLAPDCPILMLQNGLGAQLEARARWPDLHLLFASVTDGAWMAGPGHVVWAGRGETRIGDPAGGEPPAVLEGLSAGGIVWQWSADIQAVLWHKLAVNCAINPLSVLHDCRNGEVPERAGPRLQHLITELDRLLDAVGAGLLPGELNRRIRDVISRTAGNSSSMRQDVAAGRRTELDYLLGHASRTGRQMGLDLPVLDQLLAQTTALLAQRGLPTT